jgi:hypothetical protein
MKKLVTFSLIALAIYSCSTDKDITVQNSNIELTKAELETIYLRMIHSDEYKKLDAAEDAYFEKLNYNNSYIEISEKDLKHGALKWIKKHLRDTKFASLDEAEAEYENILALQGEVSKNHEAFYAAYGNEANHKYLSEIMQQHEPVRRLN